MRREFHGVVAGHMTEVVEVTNGLGMSQGYILGGRTRVSIYTELGHQEFDLAYGEELPADGTDVRVIVEIGEQ